MSSILGGLYSRLGYEALPASIVGKSFYDLKAILPGKDKVLDFVSHFLLAPRLLVYPSAYI